MRVKKYSKQREYLEQPYILKTRLERDHAEIIKVREIAKNIKGFRIKEVVVQETPKSNMTEEAIATVLDLEKEIQAIEDEYKRVRDEVKARIEAVEDERLQTVLRMRHMVYMKWKDIIEALPYERTHVFRLYSMGLGEIERISKKV